MCVPAVRHPSDSIALGIPRSELSHTPCVSELEQPGGEIAGHVESKRMAAAARLNFADDRPQLVIWLWIHWSFTLALEAESSLWIVEQRVDPVLLLPGVIPSVPVREVAPRIPAGMPAAFQAH